MADLQELGVPCAFSYISVRNTGALFTMGNKAMTKVIEESRDLILEKLSETQTVSYQQGISSDGREIHMILPPLPRPLNELNLHDLRGLVVGIIKDLGMKWSDQKPPFWPQSIPFQYPRTAPEGFQGSWTKTLREIVRSIYIYFNYNPDTHCSSITPTLRTRSQTTTSPSPAEITHCDHFFPEKEKQMSPLNDRQNQEEELDEQDEDDEEEVDVGMPVFTSPAKDTKSHDAHSVSHDTQYISHDSQYISHDSQYTSHDSREQSRPYSVQLTDQSHVRDDRSDHSDTISVCSDPDADNDTTQDHSAVSYFGYEIAPSESNHSSPLPRHSSEGECSPETNRTSTDSIQTILQPRVMYCDPRLYSQLYPRLQTPPLFLQPNLFMKQLYALSNTNTKEEVSHVTQNKDKDSPSSIPFTYSLSLPKTTLTPTLPHIQQHKKHSTLSYHQYNSKMAELEAQTKTGLKTQSQPETKSRKGKNGIYIYTNPTAPLKFMSLNSKKTIHNEVGKRRLANKDKKLIAGAPVSPQNGEAVIRKDSAYLHLMTQQLKTTKQDPIPSSIPQVSTSTSITLNESSERSMRRHPQAPLKRRRELVFHWYHSPESQPMANTKRIKTVETV